MKNNRCSLLVFLSYCAIASSSAEAPMTAAKRNLGPGWFVDGRSGILPLFVITAGSRIDVLDAYRRPSNVNPVYTPGNLPEFYRSSLLDNLPAAIRRHRAKRMVAEMRTAGVRVASAEFDVSYDIESLNMYNWFTSQRLVASYPFWTGNAPEDFFDFRIQGNLRNRRFYIHFLDSAVNDCYSDAGLFGIGVPSDACDWLRMGGYDPPILYYAKRQGAYIDVVDYADKFVVYMK